MPQSEIVKMFLIWEDERKLYVEKEQSAMKILKSDESECSLFMP